MSTRPARSTRKRNPPLLLLSAFLAAAVFALPAEASLPRADADTASTFALAGAEAVGSGQLLAARLETPFALLAGGELEKALTCNPLTSTHAPEPGGLHAVESPLLEPLELTSRACEATLSLHLEPVDFGLNPQRGPPLEIPDLHQGWLAADLKTRIGGFRLDPEDFIGGERYLSLGLQRGYLVGRPGLAEDEPPDPWGLRRGAVAEPVIFVPPVRPATAELGLNGLPAGQGGPGTRSSGSRYDISGRYMAPGAPPESWSALKASLMNAQMERQWSRVGAKALGGRTADELTEGEQREFLENRRKYRDDAEFRTRVEGLGQILLTEYPLNPVPSLGGEDGGGSDEHRVFAKTTTPWRRDVFTRQDIDWDLVRPNEVDAPGLTNWQAARKGYSPGRYNPETGNWENVVLHHLNQNPRGSLAELWRSTHGRVPHKLESQPWRKENPAWAEAFRNEQSAYWRWRTGAYDPVPTVKLYLPGDAGN